MYRNKIKKVLLPILALIVFSSCECDPDEAGYQYETTLKITYTVSEDLLDGLTPTVSLTVNGEESLFTLNRDNFTSVSDGQLEYVKTVSYKGKEGTAKMVVAYSKKADIPSKEIYAIGHSLSAQSVTTYGSSSSTSSARGAASIGSNNSSMSYSEALDETTSRGADVLAFGQALLVSSLSIAVQGK